MAVYATSVGRGGTQPPNGFGASVHEKREERHWIEGNGAWPHFRVPETTHTICCFLCLCRSTMTNENLAKNKYKGIMNSLDMENFLALNLVVTNETGAGTLGPVLRL